MDSVRVIVDGLFEEMVGQVKEMMMPPPPKERAENDQLKANAASTTTSPKPTTSVPLSQPLKSKMVFATKSKPGPSSSAASQPFSGLYKRMAEEDGGNNSQTNKKKAVTVDLQIDDSLDDEDDYGDSTLDDDSGGGNIEQQSKDTAHENIANDLKSQPKQSAEKKVACPEPECGKLFANRNLKRHMRTHTKAKPFGCTYFGCSLEFSQREHAIYHILNVHLKKQKPEVDGNEDSNEPPDPATYLTVKEELL